MKWIEVKIFFSCLDKELATDLFFNIFYDIGLKEIFVEN